MTSILPAARSPWQILDAAIGNQISQNLPGAVQQGYNRGQGLNAIDQLQNDLAQSGGDISKMLPAIARAYTLNPALERSGIAEQALLRAKANVATNPVANALGNVGQGQPGQPGIGGLASMGAQQGAQGMPQAQPSQQQMKQPSQGIFLSSYVPQNLGELITPEQKSKMITDVANSGGDINLTKQLIEDYNSGKIGVNELTNANVEKQAANTQRMLGFEDQIRDRISKYIPQDTPESEKNIYYNMVRPVLEGSTSFSDAWQKVSADIDNFRKLNEAYVNRIPDATFQGVAPTKETQLRESARPIMKTDPLAYNTLEQAYLKKGHSPITPAHILKPLPNSVKSTLSRASDYKPLIYPTNFSTSEMPERVMERNIDQANEGQQREIPRLANSLRKEWNGDFSLLNVYTDLKKKGWSLPNITGLLDEVQDLFSPRQKADRAMLNENLRIPTRYLDYPWSES